MNKSTMLNTVLKYVATSLSICSIVFSSAIINPFARAGLGISGRTDNKNAISKNAGKVLHGDLLKDILNWYDAQHNLNTTGNILNPIFNMLADKENENFEFETSKSTMFGWHLHLGGGVIFTNWFIPIILAIELGSQVNQNSSNFSLSNCDLLKDSFKDLKLKNSRYFNIEGKLGFEFFNRLQLLLGLGVARNTFSLMDKENAVTDFTMAAYWTPYVIAEVLFAVFKGNNISFLIGLFGSCDFINVERTGKFASSKYAINSIVEQVKAADSASPSIQNLPAIASQNKSEEDFTISMGRWRGGIKLSVAFTA